MEILNKKNMNFTIFDVLDIISFIILGIFWLKIKMKSLHIFILLIIILAMRILSLMEGYNALMYMNVTQFV